MGHLCHVCWVLCLRDSTNRHVHHSGKQSDTNLCFTLPRLQGLGGRRLLHILGCLKSDICLPSSSHSSQDTKVDTNFSGIDNDTHSVTTSVPTLAPTTISSKCSTTHTITGSRTVPVHSQSVPTSVLQGPTLLGLALWLLSGISSDNTTSLKQ